jgi:putative transcriptional regulator
MMVGKLLVARPSLLGDPSFGRGVVLMAEQNASGAVGFLVNQPTEYSIKDLIPEFQIDAPIFQGGPVDQDRLFYIHTSNTISNAKALGNDLFWGGELSEIEAALKSGSLAHNEVIFLIGYTGWGREQLEQECNEHSWLLVRNKYKIFSDTANLWSSILRDLGGDLAFYALAPSHPALN